jgi:hypothetical protein
MLIGGIGPTVWVDESICIIIASVGIYITGGNRISGAITITGAPPSLIPCIAILTDVIRVINLAVTVVVDAIIADFSSTGVDSTVVIVTVHRAA